jgi:hypothetical protein
MAEKQYYIRIRGKVRGPFDLVQLRALRERGQFSSFHEISEDRQMWTTASVLTEMFAPSGRAAPGHPGVELVVPAGDVTRRGSDDDIAGDAIPSSRRGRARLECPRCASPNVQSFEVIYEMGTSDMGSNSVGFAPGVGMVFGATSGTQRTRAALNASPPARRDLTGPVLAIILGVGIVLFAGLVILTGLGSGDRRGDSLAQVFSCFLFVLLVGIGILIAGISSAKSVNKWNTFEYPRLRETWLRSFRCLKCGHEFIPR